MPQLCTAANRQSKVFVEPKDMYNMVDNVIPGQFWYSRCKVFGQMDRDDIRRFASVNDNSTTHDACRAVCTEHPGCQYSAARPNNNRHHEGECILLLPSEPMVDGFISIMPNLNMMKETGNSKRENLFSESTMTTGAGVFAKFTMNQAYRLTTLHLHMVSVQEMAQ